MDDARADRLLKLATQLDDLSKQTSDSTTLTDDERLELQRLQKAMQFIDEACPANELPLSHLHNTPTGSLLPTPTDQDAATAELDTAPVPDRVGRFEIIQMIGQGGFAKVFLARDPDLNRNVALKLLRSSLFFSEDVTNRFEREARAAAVLNHPNIVPVFESGNLDGQRYIASAYCEGMTLEQWLGKNEAVPFSKSAAMIAVLADAVEHAHQRGVIHRDLKPANVLIMPFEQDSPHHSVDRQNLPGQLRITDFGLAKHAGRADQIETVEGAIVGTPAYMSPEQAAGHSKIEATSDIYSLGVLMYEMLAGEVPILGKSNIETLVAIRNNEPRSPRRLRKSIPRDLEAICLKCLSKDPLQRYPTAHELASDLRRWLSGEPIVARRASSLERARKWTVRNPWLAAAFTAVTIAMIVAVTQWRNSVSEYKRAEANLVIAGQQKERAERHFALSQDVINKMVVQVATDQSLPPKLRRSVAEKAAAFQEQLLADASDDAEVAANTILAYNRLTRILFDLTEFDEAMQSANRAIEIGNQFPDQLRVANLRGSALQMKAALLTTLDRGDESQQLITQDEQKNKPAKAIQSSNRFVVGMAKLDAREFEAAIEEFKKTVELTSVSPDPHLRFQTARANFFWGRAEYELNRLEVAREKTEVAFEYFQSVVDAKHGNLLVILEDVGRCHLQFAEIELKRMKDLDSDEEKRQAVNVATDHLQKGMDSFGELFQKNDTVARYLGQHAYCFQLMATALKQVRDIETMDPSIESFATFLKTIPKDNRYLNDIREAYIGARLDLVKLYRGNKDLASALRHAQQTVDDCKAYLETTDDQEIQAFLDRSENIVKSIQETMAEGLSN
ncbi:MAG: serine/threonine-protein kinase [Planctomycetota bacterium]